MDIKGDVCSWTALYSDESIKEIKTYLNSRKAYIGTDGHVISSVATDVVRLVLRNLTSDIAS